MKFSQAGKKALGEMEGCKLAMYMDSGGAPSIGIGHLLTKSERTSGKIVIGAMIGVSEFHRWLAEEPYKEIRYEEMVERSVSGSGDRDSDIHDVRRIRAAKAPRVGHARAQPRAGRGRRAGS